MEAFRITEFKNLPSLTTVFFVLVFFFLVKYNWQRRWLYYYGHKIDGPFAWPLIGNLLHFSGDWTDACKIVVSACANNSSVFRGWFGPHLYILNSNPEDLEAILNINLNKNYMYKFTDDALLDGLITIDENVWKRHRKIISPTFNQKILNSFTGIFCKKSLELVSTLEKNCGKGQVDVLYSFWKCTLDVVCESMCDLDSNLITGQDQYLKSTARIEELAMIRILNPIFYSDFVWKYLNPYAKEWKQCCKAISNFCKQIIEKHSAKFKEYDLIDDNRLERKRFLNHLTGLNNKNGKLTDRELMSELQTMFVAASETSAVVQSVILIMLSIHQDVQEKVHQELFSVFGGTLREPTVADLNKLEYLERVIKETMRLQPVVSLIMRDINNTVKINSYTYPAGCSVAIPIIYLHRRPDIWEDPLTFNPDRFLPENSAKRHRCAYIPFSYGVRNCIGLNYGMMSMKIILSVILRHFKVLSSNYKSVDEIQPMIMTLIAKPRDGCKVELHRRTDFK